MKAALGQVPRVEENLKDGVHLAIMQLTLEPRTSSIPVAPGVSMSRKRPLPLGHSAPLTQVSEVSPVHLLPSHNLSGSEG